ncbi:hypothetical protein VT930_07950 [Mycobacterium sherrisii]|uniref:hypothetical protein n=1 Tax=Mycobacterium sherrisii TaxID=243061 RepID=UPI002DDD7054|nr:hypothetical protein [Mycobacterium sherrisii]MEC4763042.1 hypothetical protein [Mycobacterium sherrisii]
MDNLLDLADQTLFLGERATGTTSVLQCIWVYDRGIDLDGLRDFHHQLGRGRLSRRIERSVLPFGRHRWVGARHRPGLEIAASPRPRAEIDAWLDGQAARRPDAERGPGWHLAALPLTDGGAVVSFVVTHCLTDGIGLCQALADAASGRGDAIGWPAAASRPRWRALREDVRQTVCDAAAMGRAVAAAARMVRQGHPPAGPTTQTKPRPSGTERPIAVPMAMLFFNAQEWDARAASLGGTSNALLAGLAAHLARRVGRVAPDGSVNVGMPLSERAPDDTRANAVINVDVAVTPTAGNTDLREIRSAIKEALIRHQDLPDQRWTLLPLIPLIPEWVFRRLIAMVTGSSTTVVSSNLGAIDPAANRPDGTDADYFAMKSVYPGVTNTTMYRTNGALALLSGRMHGRVFVSVLAYELGGENSNEALQRHISGVLTEFGLTATADWRVGSPV